MGTSTKKTNDNFKNKDINCWIITEGMAGTENQCIAVAESLSASYNVKRIALQQPFRTLSSFLFKTAPYWAIKGIDKEDPAPDLIIASGRKALPVALKYKDAFKVFIQDPKVATDKFDLVAIPAHDNVTGKNVIVTTGAPNRVTPTLLDEAAAKHDFSHLPKTKIAVLIGGNSKTHTMPDDFADQLMRRINPYLQSGDYGFMVTASRRTPAAIRDELQSIFNRDNCVFWDGKGDNPYHAYLANADYILVTEDSTSMLSDACTTGKPVYRLPLQGGSAKFLRLYQALENRCGVRPFEGELELVKYDPLNDAQMVADEIKKAFAKKGLSL